MSDEKIVRAWKDAEYREELDQTEQAALPEHPAGLIEVDEDDLDQVAGGGTNTAYGCYVSYQGTCELATSGCC